MQMLCRAFSDQRYEIEQMVAEDETVAVYLTHSGRHTGEFQGMPPTGRRFAYRHIHIIRFDDDDMAVEHWAVREDVVLYRQLTGELPEPEPATV